MANAVVYGAYLLAGLVLVAYVLWVRTRWRAEKQQKADKAAAAAAGSAALRSPPVISATAEPPKPPTSASVPPPLLPAQPPSPGVARPVADAVRGITMPCNLAPIVDVPAIATAADRAAFVTSDAPFEVVSAALEAALQALGYQVGWVGDELAHAQRDADGIEISVRRFPRSHGYTTAPESSVVVDMWIEAT
jgi:hypothetical protein